MYRRALLAMPNYTTYIHTVYTPMNRIKFTPVSSRYIFTTNSSIILHESTPLLPTGALYSKKAPNAPNAVNIDPAKTFPAPEIGADVPEGPTMGLPVPAREEETKEAEAEAVTRVGAEV